MGWRMKRGLAGCTLSRSSAACAGNSLEHKDRMNSPRKRYTQLHPSRCMNYSSPAVFTSFGKQQKDFIVGMKEEWLTTWITSAGNRITKDALGCEHRNTSVLSCFFHLHGHIQSDWRIKATGKKNNNEMITLSLTSLRNNLDWLTGKTLWQKANMRNSGVCARVCVIGVHLRCKVCISMCIWMGTVDANCK